MEEKLRDNRAVERETQNGEGPREWMRVREGGTEIK